MDQSRSQAASAGLTPFFERWGAWLCCLLLAVGTLAVFRPVAHFDFVNMDDPSYVYENAQVQAGLTWENFKWVWRANVGANWHPLTLLSHMLDCQLFGVNPGRHHLVNLLLHTGNACVLFLLMLRMTGRRAASLVIAALFAWHPLHVESVAWIAERKDVLSTFFGLLALYAYIRYAEQSKIENPKSKSLSENWAGRCGGSFARGLRWLGRHSPLRGCSGLAALATAKIPHRSTRPNFQTGSKISYALALFCYTLSLLAKPMLVTLPFVLLLLDYWPLRRIKGEGVPKPSWQRLIWEKAPFLLLAAISCCVTLWAQKAGNAVVNPTSLPLEFRLAHAGQAYWLYLGKLFWPTNLAIFYPYEDRTTLAWTAFLPLAALLAASALIVIAGKKRYLAVGWLWFCGMLVPVIGLVQVGFQAMADRYAYLPSVGIFMIAALGLGELAAKARFGRATLFVLTSVVLVACLAGTSRQLSYWRDGIALYSHAIAVTQDNYVACNNLGAAFDKKGDLKQALSRFDEALRIMPQYPDAHYNRGSVYRRLNRRREAIQEFQAALSLDTKNARAHYFLGLQFDDLGDAPQAIEQLRIALSLEPERAEIHYQLGIILPGLGQIEEAQQHMREAIREKPGWVEAMNNLAWSLATYPDAHDRDGRQATELALRGVELTHTNNPTMLDTLSAAYAEAGRFPEATQTAQAALQLAQKFHAEALAREIGKHLQSYREQKPVREDPAKPSSSAVSDPVTP